MVGPVRIAEQAVRIIHEAIWWRIVDLGPQTAVIAGGSPCCGGQRRENEEPHALTHDSKVDAPDQNQFVHAQTA